MLIFWSVCVFGGSKLVLVQDNEEINSFTVHKHKYTASMTIAHVLVSQQRWPLNNLLDLKITCLWDLHGSGTGFNLADLLINRSVETID